MIVSLLTLSSCSSKPPETVYETRYEKQYIPSELLKVDCEEAPAGWSVRTLAASWVNNRGCLRAYKTLVDGIKKNYTKEGTIDDRSIKE